MTTAAIPDTDSPQVAALAAVFRLLERSDKYLDAHDLDQGLEMFLRAYEIVASATEGTRDGTGYARELLEKK